MHSGERLERATLTTLALHTFWYSLVLAAIMQAAHAGVRLALAALLSLAALPGTLALVAELAQKITWTTLVCEALVFASILMRRRWLLLVLTALFASALAVLAGDLLAALIESVATRLSSFDAGAALNDALFRGGKYLFLGAALAWVNRQPAPGLSHYVLAGSAAALIAVALTLVVRASDGASALASQLTIESIFPLGCALVVWKMRQLAAPLIQTHQNLRGQLRRV